MEPVNIVELTQSLKKRQRGKACIVLTRDFSRQNTWAKNLASLSGSRYCDIIDELSGVSGNFKLSSFNVNGLFNYLEAKYSDQIVVVSGVECIKATWSYNPQKAMKEFLTKIEMWSTSPALLFVMQHDPLIANNSFTRFSNLQFVVDQQNTIAL